MPIFMKKFSRIFLGKSTKLYIVSMYCLYRTATARGKAEQADIAGCHAREDAQIAVNCAKEFGADPTSLDKPLPSLEINNAMASKTVTNNLLSMKTNAATAVNSK